jgi:AcrR family transcriptional regulator
VPGRQLGAEGGQPLTPPGGQHEIEAVGRQLAGEAFADAGRRAVGVARATLYYYFSGRDDLVSFLLSRHLELGGAVVAEAASGDDPPDIRLLAVLEGLIGFLGEHPGVCGGLLSVLGSGAGIEGALAANDRAIAGPLRELLVEGRALGRLTFDDTADAANTLIGGILLAVLGRAAGRRPTTDPQLQRSVADHLVGGLLPGRLPVGVGGDAAVDDQVDSGDP